MSTSNVDLVQRQLDLYNKQYLDAYVMCYAPDCEIAGLNGAVTEKGRDAVKARYAAAFAKFPQNKAYLKSRIAVGGTVVDHEHVVRAPGGEEFEIICIYTIKDGLIQRADFAK